MELKLVDKKDPILTRPCDDFDFNNPPMDPIEFAKDMVKAMYDWNGLGLAANQVGIPYRVFAMRGQPTNFVCFNPKIIRMSEQEVSLEEGCLTFKGLLVKVTRPSNIRVRFTMANGENVTHEFTGMSARVFQHEMDHLDGKLFFNRANRYHRDQALKKWRNGEMFEMRIKA